MAKVARHLQHGKQPVADAAEMARDGGALARVLAAADGHHMMNNLTGGNRPAVAVER